MEGRDQVLLRSRRHIMSQSAQVLARASSIDKFKDELEGLLDKYRLYSRGEFGEGDSLVGIYEDLEDAEDKMHSISYDAQPSLFFYIMQGDDVVFGEK